MIRRKKKLGQKKMPFWNFINSLLVSAGIRYFLSPYVRNYKKNFFNKDRFKGVRVVYLSPSRDEYYMVSAGNSLALNQGIQEEQ
ncbi:hypothetical protein MKX03_034307, partial [Papaver bracteatum]